MNIPRQSRNDNQWPLWSLGMDKYFHPTLFSACNYLPMLGLKLIPFSIRAYMSESPFVKFSISVSSTFANFSFTYVELYRYLAGVAVWFITPLLPWYQSSWGQHGAHLGPDGPRWAPCWPTNFDIWVNLVHGWYHIAQKSGVLITYTSHYLW